MRKFKELVKIGKGAKALEHSEAAKAVEKLGGEVFHTEDGLSYTTAVQKAQERKRKVKPLLDEFYEFISKIKKLIGRLKTASVPNF